MTAVIPEKPAKSRLDVIEDGDTLIINAPPRRGFIGWFLTAGLVFFFALFCTCIYFVIFPDKDMSRMKAAGMAAGFLFFSAFEFWCVCIYQLHYRILYFTADKLRIKNRILWFQWTKTVERSLIWGLNESVTPSQLGNIYEVELQYGKTSVSILSGGNEEQAWLSAVVNDYLTNTGGRRLRCPACYRGVALLLEQEDFSGHRCLWCNTVFTENEALAEGEKDFDNTLCSDGVIRPLYSRIGAEKDGTKLMLRFAPYGLQKTAEKFGVSLLFILTFCAVLLIAVLLSFLPFLMFMPGAFVICGITCGLIMASCAVLDAFYASHTLELTPCSIWYNKGGIFRRNQKIESEDGGPLHTLDGGYLHIFVEAEKPAPNFAGQYQVSLHIGKKKIMLPCSGLEEQLWLFSVLRCYKAI